MAKIRLSLDDLQVDSFDVDASPPESGTVRGQALDSPPLSCDGTCMSDVSQPCDPLCTRLPTCVPSCQTCPPSGYTEDSCVEYCTVEC